MIEMSRSRFERSIAERRENNDEHTRTIWAELSLGCLENFWKPGGMTIGEFSRMMGPSVSSIRFHINLGLIEPYKVDGKYRFHPFNVWELKSVQNWQSLGLSLDEISRRREKIRASRPGTIVLDVLGPLEILGRENPEGLIWLRRTKQNGGYREDVLFGVNHGDEELDEVSEELFGELKADLQEARRRLEQKLEALTNKLTRIGRKSRAIS